MKFLKQRNSFQAGSLKLPLAGFPPTSPPSQQENRDGLHPISPPANTHPWGWICAPTEKIKSCYLTRR